MFPYSLGVQASTVAEAKGALADQIEQLEQSHPEAFATHGAHVKAAQTAAEAVADLLSADTEDTDTDVAISVHGTLSTLQSGETKPHQVRNAEFHAYAGRLPRDPSKYRKATPAV